MDSVSRETSPWSGVFGDALPAVRRYADLLATAGLERGLIGPREVDRLWERHLANCAVVADLVPPRSTTYDVGSGAGLPGLVLALVRPDLDLYLVESLERRVRFLQEAVEKLEVPNASVVHARAEDLAGLVAADVVTARAVAPLARLAGWCLPLLRPDGSLLAVKGARAQDELVAAEPALRRLGATTWSVERLGVDRLQQPTTVVRVVAGRTPGRGRARPAKGADR